SFKPAARTESLAPTGTAPRAAVAKRRETDERLSLKGNNEADCITVPRLNPTSWTEPIAEWRPAVDSDACQRWLTARGQPVAAWPPAAPETAPTVCFALDGCYWIWQPDAGGIRFRADEPRFTGFPSTAVDPRWFRWLVTRSWLPSVYPFWGRQVLHATAAAHEPSGTVVAFTGPSGAGKSTMAFALGRQPGWSLICDDTLAFSPLEDAGALTIALHPLPTEARLRPASAAHFGVAPNRAVPLKWPRRPVRLSTIYSLQADPDLDRPVSISKVGAGESYARLLEQAHALTLDLPDHTQRLMRDYLALATTVPVFRLAYRKSFEAIAQIVTALEPHTAARLDAISA